MDRYGQWHHFASVLFVSDEEKWKHLIFYFGWKPARLGGTWEGTCLEIRRHGWMACWALGGVEGWDGDTQSEIGKLF